MNGIKSVHSSTFNYFTIVYNAKEVEKEYFKLTFFKSISTNAVRVR